jgi:hypothetical protein
MKKNIKEANISRSRQRPRGNDRISPGEGSINPDRTLPPQPQSNLPVNRRLARQAGTQASKQGRTGPSTTYRTDIPRPPEKSSSGGGVTFYSVAPDDPKPESKKPESTSRLTSTELQTVLNSLSARQKRKKGLPTGGPVDLTSRGKRLKPGGDAESKRIRDAKRAGSQTRLDRAHRKKIIKEFIEKYRKSILK